MTTHKGPRVADRFIRFAAERGAADGRFLVDGTHYALGAYDSAEEYYVCAYEAEQSDRMTSEILLDDVDMGGSRVTLSRSRLGAAMAAAYFSAMHRVVFPERAR